MTDAELREIAEKATPGPWYAVHNGHFFDIGVENRQYAPSFASVHYSPPEKTGDNNAAFIAAFNPATALALLARLARAEESRAVWRTMDTAPLDGKHCILAVKEGAFTYSVQGAFDGKQWNCVHRANVQPLYWMPNVLTPAALTKDTSND